jgi:hypothetical protein
MSAPTSLGNQLKGLHPELKRLHPQHIYRVFCSRIGTALWLKLQPVPLQVVFVCANGTCSTQAVQLRYCDACSACTVFQAHNAHEVSLSKTMPHTHYSVRSPAPLCSLARAGMHTAHGLQREVASAALFVGARGAHELGKRAGAVGEVAWAAALHEAAICKHQQLVAVGDGVHAVRDDQHHALHRRARALHRLPQRALDYAVRRPARAAE